MSNCRGYIYGLATSTSDGSPIPNVDVTLNWVQVEGGGSELKTAGNDALTTYVPRVTTTAKGEYIVPFFWPAEKVPGSLASALAMLYYSDGSSTPNNQHGTVSVEPDVAKFLKRFKNTVSPSMPDSVGGAASTFLGFYISATPELKGMGILTGFLSDFDALSTEQQAIYCRINFTFDLPPKVLAVGTKPG
jgi:hypothetical protein